MVNRNVLKKLSDSELEKYLKEDSRFVPEAVQIAFEILIERGRDFSDEEKENIQKLINKKENEELERLREEKELKKDHITEDANAIRLYSRGIILFFGVFFGFVSGAILLGLNFFKLKKYKEGILVILLGFIYSIIQYFGVSLMYKMKSAHEMTSYRKSPELLFIIFGVLVLYFIWIEVIKKLPYRSESLLIPILLGLLMSFLIYTNFNNWFSSYFLINLAR
ncbi:hypothetical protein [Epilithonimonas sp.]|uniref:hypothetical protein n=1 Tax=Epilithonimonas sp. TaxID=2894511 RepID=UPI00289C4A0A|nr:hypothetical protein [Epilithonimonas sp.]